MIWEGGLSRDEWHTVIYLSLLSLSYNLPAGSGAFPAANQIDAGWVQEKGIVKFP